MTPKDLLADVLRVEDIEVRPAEPGDLGYVVDSFFRTYRDEQPEVRTSDYAAWVRLHLRHLMTREESKILVAHDGGKLRGWIAFGPGERLDYIFVSHAFRGFGVARKLMDAAGFTPGEIVVTHLTDAARAYRRTHPDRFRYVPLP